MALFGRSRRKVEIKIDPTQIKEPSDELIQELEAAATRLEKVVGRGEAVNRELGKNIAKAEALNRKRS